MARRFRSGIASVFFLAMLLIAVERPAQAYTDPGTGALVLQTVTAAFVGFLFYLRKVSGWLRSRRGPKE